METKKKPSLSAFSVKGLVTAPFTPMKDNGDINPEVLDEYVDHIQSQGISNVFINGTTGEGLSLTIEERKTMAEAWMKTSEGKLRCIIVHVGGGNQRDSIELAAHAQSIGVDAIAAISPSYYKPKTEEAVVEYMKPIAAAAPNTPFFYYAISQMTGITPKNYRVCELSMTDIPTFRGIKHSCPSTSSLMLTRMVDNSLQVLDGSGEYLAALSIGVELSVVQSYMGAVNNRIREAFLAGDMANARTWQQKTNTTKEICRKYGGDLAVGKAIMCFSGVNLGPARLPLVSPSDEIKAKLKDDLTQAGFFAWTKATKSETERWFSHYDN